MVGLVAQDGAAGVVGDDSGDAHQPQADRPGLPGAGGSVGHGEQLGEDQQVTGQWTAGCFSDSACLCFRLPSLSPGNRFRPRRECDTLGLSEDGHDCISVRSMRQYP